MSSHGKKIISSEEKKRLILRVGVIVTSLVIMILWIVGLSFSFSSKNISTEIADNSWRQDVQETIDAVRGGLNGKALPTKEEKTFLDGMLTNIENKDQTSIASSSVDKATTTDSLKKDESKKFLKTLKDKLPAVGIASSSCPAYINCMPTIGQARSCVIPAGCEDITQIAY